MMDFLRRLAPPRETDSTRAVAVLASRFASDNPLRGMLGQTRPNQRLNEDEASLLLDTTSAPAANNALAARRHTVTGVQTSESAPRPPGSGSTRRANGKATSSTHAPAESPDIDAVFRDRQGAHSERATPTNAALAAALAVSHNFQGSAAPPAQPRAALPLSEALLAQRTLQSQADSPIVHVTIGRIDVVANTAPAPIVRRSPTPRQGTVTLADYLRGGNGSRR